MEISFFKIPKLILFMCLFGIFVSIFKNEIDLQIVILVNPY